MLIAQQKRQENIAEYLLYMWQVEDLLRACALDDEKIDATLVRRFAAMPGMTDERLAEIRRWYTDLAQMMRSEGKQQSGHLQINQNVIIDLTDLHLRLLRQKKDAVYTAAFYSTLPHIVELRAREGEAKIGELETCFMALYGLMTLRLEGREVSDDTRAAMQQIAKFLALLSDRYRQWKAGELDMDEE